MKKSLQTEYHCNFKVILDILNAGQKRADYEVTSTSLPIVDEVRFLPLNQHITTSKSKQESRDFYGKHFRRFKFCNGMDRGLNNNDNKKKSKMQLLQ